MKNKIKIYGINYDINLIESNSRIDDAMGRIDSKMGVINLSKEMPSGIRFRTLIHELIEAINEENELKLKHNIIQSLSNGISEILLENNIYNYSE